MKNSLPVLLAFFFFTSFLFSQSIQWQQLSGPHGGSIYSLVADNSGYFYANTVGTPGPFKSTDGGQTWFSIMNGLTPGDNGGFHPLNINSSGDLFIGGANNAGGLCRSTNGGSSWESLNNLNPGSSIICIAFDNSVNVYVGTGTGIYKSTDNGDNWSQYGMIGSQTESIAFNDSGHVFAGTSYAVYRSKDAGANWTQLPTGGGTRTVGVAPNGYVFAGCHENGGILRSTDNGDTWTYSYPQTVQIKWASTVLYLDDNIWFPTYGKGVLHSTDYGDTWTELNNGLGYKYVRAVAASEWDLLAGTDYGIYSFGFYYSYWKSIGLPLCGVKEIALNIYGYMFAGVWGVNRSVDGGQNWETINNGFVNLDIRALVAKDNGYLFAGTNDSPDGTVFRSADNGDNWVRVDNFPTGVAINGLAVGLNGEIIATASGYHILCQKSTDDGITWQDIKYGQDIGCGKVAFNSAGDLFSASYGGGFWKLPFGDTTWINLTANNGSNWISSLFISSNDYIFTDGKRSIDNGLTWTAINGGSYIYSHAENSAGHLFFGTNSIGQGVYRSLDFGETLELISDGIPPSTEIKSLAVDSQDYLYAGTGGKSMFKTTTSTVTDVSEINFAPTSFSLEQNYPNPFNPSTTIKYTIPNVTLSGVEGSRVRLKVYDVLGNEIATLVNEEKRAGEYEVEFQSTVSSRQLASGVYFYQLKVGSLIQTKKMIYLK